MQIAGPVTFYVRFAITCSVICLAQIAFAQTNYRVEKYNTLNGLVKDHWVNCIKTDSSGMIWLALNKGGLARFDGDVFTFYPLPAEWEKYFGESAIQMFAIDQRGKFWINGLSRILFFDPATGQFTLPADIDGLVNEEIKGLHETRNGSIVFFSKGKIYRRQPAGKVQLAGNMQAASFNPWIFDVEEDDRGDLWVLSNSGYYYYPPGQPEPEFFGFKHTPANPFPPVQPPLSLFYDSPPGTLWYAESPRKIVKINMQGAVIETYAMREFELLHSVIETGDLRWFGAFDGLIKVTHRNSRFTSWLDIPFDMAQSPSTGASCYGLAESKNGTIYTISDNLHEIFPNQPGSVRTIPLDKDGRRFGMLTDRQGRLWITRYNTAVSVFDPATKVFRRLTYDKSNGLSNSLMQDKAGKIWLACASGIVWIDPGTEQTTTFHLPEKDFVWHLHLADDGTIWAATKNGILKINPQTGATVRFNPANTPGMATGEILSIHETDRFLWCGSTGGLIRLEKQTGRATTFTIQQGLPNDQVYAAIPAEGFLWLPTNKGLARVSLASAGQENTEVLDVATFGTDDGLPHHEFNTLTFLQAQDGKIWLGGLNGIVAFDPKDLILQKSEENEVIVAEFSKYDQQEARILNFPVFKNSPPEPFVLRPREKFFTVRFALLDYRDPKANQYRYKLEGFDADWIFAGNQNTTRYANLPPGRYMLRIRGANPNGVWSGREATATIIVEQVWYKTAWAWAFYTLLAVGLAYLAWWIRLRQLRLAHQLDLEHVRTQDLQNLESFKSRFFTNITHEFRTPLTVVLGTTEQARSALETQRQAADIPSLLSKMTLIKRNGENLLRLINQILDLAKLESNALNMNYIQGDILTYLRYITESLHSLANIQNVLLRVESDQTDLIMDYDPDRLLQIVHNLLANAIKFTLSGGRVTLRITIEPIDVFENAIAAASFAVITVADTGMGIPPADLPHIFDRFFQANQPEKAKTGGTGIGLALTKELVKAMNGTIAVESQPKQGTTFTVRLPITQNATQKADKLAWPAAIAPWPDHRPAEIKRTPVLPEELAGKPNLLIIEDNPDVVEYLVACLREIYTLDLAYNGRAGIEKALETVPDLIISDVMMPEKTGFEVCDVLKNDERTSHIPCMLLTARADLDSRITGLRRGADAYMAKPFHPEELRLTLHNLLELRRRLQHKYLAWAIQSPTGVAAGMPAEPTLPADPENEFLRKLRLLIEEHLADSNLDVETICRKIGMGRTNLHNKLSALTGLSITLYVRKLRLRHARELLSSSDENIAEIAYAVGFNDPKFFSRVYAEEYGLPPSEWRVRYRS